MTTKTLLFVATRFPYPPHGGDRLRVFRILCELAKEYEVTLLVLANERDSDFTALKAASGVRNLVAIRQAPLERGLGLLRALWRGDPLQVGYFSARAMSRWVAQHGSKFDVGVFHLLRGAQYAEQFLGGVKVIEMCDANSETFRQNLSITHWYQPWHWVCRIEAPRALAFERAAMARFDLVTLHTRHDAEIVSPTLERTLISTQGVDLEQYPFLPPSQRHGRKLVFIGKMDFHPNLDAMLWFVEHVLASLPQDFTLKIVGVCPPEIAQRLRQLNGRIEITGRVDSIAEAATAGSIGIAPMRSATGIQNKVLEYFALGLPVVTTGSVMKGLMPDAQGCVLVAESAIEWADAIGRLASESTFRDDLARRGRRYVENSHNWSRIGLEYREALAQLNK